MAKRGAKFRTGDKVPAAGTFESVTGRKMKYGEGDLFQACPESGEPTDWRRCDA